MDIQGTENKLKQVDSLLTTFTNLLKRHWFVLILIGICAFCYWAMNLPDEEVKTEPETEMVDDTQPTDEPVDDGTSDTEPVDESSTDTVVDENMEPQQ